MKLSQILDSESIHLGGEKYDGDSWGIFLYPENPGLVVKLFKNEQQFNNEKASYDNVLGDLNLRRFANQYGAITIDLDMANCPKIGKSLPFKNALIIPLLSSPPWKEVGKLGFPETERDLNEYGIDVEETKENFEGIGLAWWEATFFVNTVSGHIKAIDFTYSEVVSNSCRAPNESD